MISPALTKVSGWAVVVCLVLTSVVVPVLQVVSGRPDAAMWQILAGSAYALGILFAVIFPFLLMSRFRRIRGRIRALTPTGEIIAWWEESPASAKAGVLTVNGRDASIFRSSADHPDFFDQLIRPPRVEQYANGRHDCIRLSFPNRELLVVPMGRTGIFPVSDWAVSKIADRMAARSAS